LLNHQGKKLAEKNNFEIIMCENCKFIHVVPIPTDDDLLNLYKNQFFQKIKPNDIEKEDLESEYWKTTYDDKLFSAKNFLGKSGHFLDIGCGSGSLLLRAKELGWEVFGIEPSQIAAKYAENKGLSIIEDFFQNIDFSSLGKFDVIHMKNLLEHTPSPVKILEKCKSILSDQGILIIEVPNDFNPLQDIAQKILNKPMYWIDPPVHINYFNFNSLSTLLESNSFKILLKESTFPLEMFLLMGNDYLGNDVIGKKKHIERMQFEKNLIESKKNDLKRNIYKHFADMGIGRSQIIYAQIQK
jgi:SAM-dependent methyltransferase